MKYLYIERIKNHIPMCIKVEINPDAGLFNVTITTPLLEKYYSNLRGMVINEKSVPKNLTIERSGTSTASIQFPIPAGSIVKQNTETITVDKDLLLNGGMSSVLNVTHRFVCAALSAILKNTEFLPFLDFSGGYSFEELQSDVKRAVEAKRDFLMVDTYKNYLEGTKDGGYRFSQYPVKYGTSEYVDIAILIVSGNLEELRKIYKTKLKLTDWI